MTIADQSTDVKEEAKEQKNAYAIHIKSKLNKVQKDELKHLGCHYNDIIKKRTIPREKDFLINEYLISQEVDYTLEEVQDDYFLLPPNKQKAINLDMACKIKSDDTLDRLKEIEKTIDSYNKLHASYINLKNIQDYCKNGIPDINNKDQKARLLLIMDLFKKLLERGDEIEELKERADNLYNQGEITSASKKIIDYLHENEIGDAKLFVELFKGKYVFDPTEGKNGEYYLWNGKNWEIDLHKERYKDFERLAEEYENVSRNENLEKSLAESLSKRAQVLRTNTRRKSVFETISSKISFKGTWDAVLKTLPCANGIVDLVTGDFDPITPDLFIRKICPVNYNPDAECPKFKQFLNDISLGDLEWVNFLQRVIGYIILGVPTEEIIIYLYGENGRNGKGTLTKLLQSIFGSLVKTFSAEMLLLQRNPPSSSAPSPEFANLEGVRVALFSEINQGRRIDSAKVKNLSGRDKISCRRLFSDIDLQIEPSHTMILQTNYKPKAPADDKALWHRNILIPFKASFVREPKLPHERPLNEGLKEELLKESEGILIWILEGVYEYQSNGLKIPDFIKEETENYRKENDGIGKFLEDICVCDPALSTRKTEMKKAIQEYCSQNECEVPTNTEILSKLKLKFQEGEDKKGSYWKGVSIRRDETEGKKWNN